MVSQENLSAENCHHFFSVSFVNAYRENLLLIIFLYYLDDIQLPERIGLIKEY